MVYYPSRLDPAQQLSKDLWGVTLIRKDKKKDHVALALEGVDDQGKQFLKCIHLTGIYTTGVKTTLTEKTHYFFGHKGKVKISDIDETKPVIYGDKTLTWIRTRDSVKALIDSVTREANDFDEGRSTNPTPFNILGSRSLLVKKEKVIEIDNDELSNIVKKYGIKKFKAIYNCTKNPNYYSPNLKYKTILAADGLFRGLWNICKVAINRHKYAKIVAEVGDTRLAYLGGLMKTHVKEVKRTPENCFTWAKKKLNFVGISIPARPSDRLVTKTSWYLNGTGLSSLKTRTFPAPAPILIPHTPALALALA